MICNVYRFINNNNEIIYVGKTQNGIKNRINQHFSKSGHLDSQCYKEVSRIEYIIAHSQIDMDIKELYYINKWKPKYNIISKYEDNNSDVEIDTSDDNWQLYNPNLQRRNGWNKLSEIKPQPYETILVYINGKIEMGTYWLGNLDLHCISKKFELWHPLPKVPNLLN